MSHVAAMPYHVSHPAAVHPRFGVRVATFATVVMVVAVMCVSNMLLIAVGVPYASTGGSFLTKIHPATYLALVTVLIWASALGGGRFLARTAIGHTGVVAMVGGIVLLLFHAGAIVKLSLSPVIDTFILPLFLFMALINIDERTRTRLETLVHVILVVNALIGVFEYGSGRRLVPMYDTDGTVMSYDWRATALFGHPLANAFLNGSYFVALALGATPRINPTLRFALMGLSALAMIAFGGRTAMVIGLAMGGFFAGLAGVKMLAGKTFRLRYAILGVALAALGAVFVVVFIDSGGADRFLQRFSEDHGSAQTRVSMFRIFGALTWEQFLLWPDGDLIFQAQREYSLRIGVESAPVGFVANYGLIVTIVFFAALAAFMNELVKETGPKTWWSVLYFVVIMSASIGIAAKTTGFAVWLAIHYLIMPRRPSRPSS